MMEAYTKRMNQQHEQEALLAAQREQELCKQKQAKKEEPPQNSDFCQLIREMCGIKASAEQNQKPEEMMLELLELCREKEFYRIDNSIEDLIGRAMNTILLSINLKSQRLDKEKQEVKNIMEHVLNIELVLQNLYEVIKSSVKNLVLIPSESEVISDNECECDVPINDESSLILTTFSNPLFDCNDDFTSSDDKSLSNEDVLMENFKIYSNSLFDDEESISTKIDLHHFNAESNLLQSLLNRDTLIESSPKFDYILKEFSGELAHINPIPLGIKEADFDLEEEIGLVENLLYDNSSPRPPQELNVEIAVMILKSLSPSPIPVEDSDSHMDEIDLFLATDDLMPPAIKNDDYDSKGDIHFLEKLLRIDLLPLPENKSSNFDHHDDPSLPRPPPKPLDVEIFFDFEPNTGVLTTKVVRGISEHYVLMPKVLPSQPALCLNIDTLLPFSFENKDKSQIELYMLNCQHGMMILESVKNGPLLWLTVKEDGVTRVKKYFELSAAEAIQAECDVKATNIILQGLPSKVYALERECKLYDVFDKFAYRKGESLRYFYLRFSLLLNDMNMYNMKLKQFQMDYAPTVHQQSEFSSPETGLVVLIFQKGDNLIDAINHMMSFLAAIVTLRYPATNNQLRTSSNPWQQATINNGRVTIQPIQGRQNSMIDGSSRPYASGYGGALGKQRVIVCYNCKGEGHMSKQCTKPKRNRDAKWFKEKALGFQNPCYLRRAQQLKPKLYDGSVIKKSDAIVIHDSEETLLLAEASRLKMIEKQNDPKIAEKKVITKPIDYAVLHQLSKDFETCFVPQAALSTEQAFWSRYSVQPEEPNLSASTTIVEVPKELPKVSLANLSLKNFKFHLASFDMVVKERDTATAITEGTWGFEYTKACFRDDIIPFVKTLNELFNSFDQFLLDELSEVQQSLCGDVKERKVKREIEEIETLNIEVDHRVTKLVAKNEHLNQTYKQLYDLIKPSRVRSKEQCDDLITQVNLKSAKISDLNVSLQEKVLVITALKESLSKLKGKNVVNEAVPLHSIDPDASGSKSQNNTKNDRIQQTSRKAKKNKLEEHLRTFRPSLNKKSVVDTKATSSVTNSMSNVNSDLKCASCNGCLFFDNHDACVVAYINSVNASIKSKSVKKPVVQIVLWYLDSGCLKHMIGDRSQLINFVQKFLGMVKFENDHVAKIMGYDDYQIGNVTISRVYYVEGLGHNLFSVGQLCDSDLEVAFHQHTCFIRNLNGVDLLIGSRENNLYTLSLQDMMSSSPVCLLSKASKTKSWLWHRRLSHLNIDHPIRIVDLHIFRTIVLILCGPMVSLLVATVSRLDRGGGGRGCIEMCLKWNKVKRDGVKVLLLQSQAMQLHKLFQLAYDVHMCGMIPRIIHKKSSISLNNTSQISPVNAIAPYLPTKEPEYSLSMGDEHLSTIP
nr:integrase, catalytic region, zinc finger, CCHC-type, peptidase aspartic, catalytic [Tanacetum cinerariifolium]